MSDGEITRDRVHKALSHLNDNDLLANSALVASLPGMSDVVPLEKRADRMRALMLEAIEVLRPSRQCAFGSPTSRHYDVLCLRYVENMPVAAVMQELRLSRRQVHRDLEEAESRLAEVLASRARLAAETLSPPRDALTDELVALQARPAEVDLKALARSAYEMLRPLAEQFHVHLALSAPGDDPVPAIADPAVLSQLIVQFAACAIQAATRDDVTISLGQDGVRASVAVRFAGPPGSEQLAGIRDARDIALSQGIPCQIHADEGGYTQATLLLHRGEPRRVLVVEDNPGAIDLYRRYLAPEGWQVTSVSDPSRARELATRPPHDAIILDIMMPGQDGWSVLQSLGRDPDTADIPVVVCSVVGDARLALALGAKAYIRKPVARGELLATLNRCLPARQRREPA